MYLEIIILSEVKSDRERQISYDITYMWNLKKNDAGMQEIIFDSDHDMNRED